MWLPRSSQPSIYALIAPCCASNLTIQNTYSYGCNFFAWYMTKLPLIKETTDEDKLKYVNI